MSCHHGARSRSRHAFTLLELIVVITIIGILGTIVTIKVLPTIAVARGAKTQADLKQIVSIARQIYVVTGSWPESIADMVNPRSATGASLPGLDEAPKDAWSREYLYELHDDGPIVRCLGRDGAEGGEGEDADFAWPPRKAS